MLRQTLDQRLSSLTAQPATTHEQLTVIPLCGPDSDQQITSLASGLDTDQVEVREVSQAGMVARLAVKNRSISPAFILDGEELVGGKQARVVNSSILCPPGREIMIPVSCCEAGRWRRTGKAGFVSRKRSMPSSLKASKSLRLSQSLRESRGHDADQTSVWREIDDFSALRGVRSPTRALGDVFEADRAQIDKIVRSVSVRSDQVGIAAFHGKRLLALEVFSSARLYSEVNATLLHSFATDVLMRRNQPVEAPASYCGTSLLAFASQVIGGELSEHGSPGLGTDVRVTGALGQANALVFDDELIHLSVFTP